MLACHLCSFAHACEDRSPQAGTSELAYAFLPDWVPTGPARDRLIPRVGMFDYHGQLVGTSRTTLVYMAGLDTHRAGFCWVPGHDTGPPPSGAPIPAGPPAGISPAANPSFPPLLEHDDLGFVLNIVLTSDSGKNALVLVEIVRFTQKQGLKGAVGGWKDFLTRHDKKFGSSLSDPAKRSKDILIAFLETFPQQFQKYFGKMVKRHYDRKTIEQYIKDYPDKESPEQRLVRLTMENPQYMQHYFFPSYNEGWKVMTIGKTSEVMNSKAMISIDCEMVLCQDGTESVVKVCAVDQNLEVKLNKVVNPNKAVADYRTHITGISAKDLEGVTCSLVDVQCWDLLFERMVNRITA
uniref:Exonuclease domain-containing protein n=1 Tax=Ananas comosus var. bracteatus TaxID=296719 RepID=A0A6V7NTG9_ANACO|nr:unnamed protein product [Ananas comosus var. bracteatus]